MNMPQDIIYSLTLNPAQRTSALKAVDLLIHIKDGCFDVIFDTLVCPDSSDYHERKEATIPLLYNGFQYIFSPDVAAEDVEYERLIWLKNQLSKRDDEGAVLTMTADQAHALYQALDLLIRLKLDQPNELTHTFLPYTAENYCDRRDCADHYFHCAFRQIFPTLDSVKKDDEWHRLYNIFQVLRYAFFNMENPSSKGVDSDPPMTLSAEPLPSIDYKKG